MGVAIGRDVCESETRRVPMEVSSRVQSTVSVRVEDKAAFLNQGHALSCARYEASKITERHVDRKRGEWLERAK